MLKLISLQDIGVNMKKKNVFKIKQLSLGVLFSSYSEVITREQHENGMSYHSVMLVLVHLS